MSARTERLAARDHARDRLRQLLPPRSPVWVLQTGASRTAPVRYFRVFAVDATRVVDRGGVRHVQPGIIEVTAAVARACELRFDVRSLAIRLDGAGYSGASDIAESLGSYLHNRPGSIESEAL